MTNKHHVLCFITKALFDIIKSNGGHQFHARLVHEWDGNQDIYYIKALIIK